MSKPEWSPGAVSQTPSHDGDGYGYGGDYVATINGTLIVLGPRDRDLARLIAAAPDLYEALEALEQYLRETAHHNMPQVAAARAALAKARGETE